MQAISIIGFSNSGKTTLISRLSECLEARGLKVAIAKHTLTNWTSRTRIPRF